MSACSRTSATPSCSASASAMASSVSETDADLCILGSGIAGMLLAERAIAQGRRVLMIERGTAMPSEERLRQRSHDDPLPFNRSPLRLPHEAPPAGPRTRWDRDYPFWPVYNLGGCTNSFFGNMPRWHPAHFDQPAFAGGVARRWPISYADLEPYYLEAERRLAIAGNSEVTPFPGRFAYPLPPHRLSPSDRACETIFGKGTVLQVPTTRPSRSVGTRPECCGTNKCELCPDRLEGHRAQHRLPLDPVENRSAHGPAGHHAPCARGARPGRDRARRGGEIAIASTPASSSSPATGLIRACCCSARPRCRSCPAWAAISWTTRSSR